MSDSDFCFCVQRNLLVQTYRPFAFWASVSCENDEIISRVRHINMGVAAEREPIRPSTIKEYAVLTSTDLQEFNTWLLAQDKVGYKEIRDELSRLRHRRWAWWHVMASDNPNVAEECRMPTPRLHCRMDSALNCVHCLMAVDLTKFKVHDCVI